MSQESLIDAAKAPVIAYGKKDWDALRAAITPSFLYEEVATHRKMQGVDQFIAGWQGWATALPDSKATIHNAFVSGDTVVLEVTWRGTHKGPLQTPTGPIAATGKPIEIEGPLNVIAGPPAPPIPELARLGVRRASLGPRLIQATLGLLRRVVLELRAHGTYEAMRDLIVPFGELQRVVGG